MARQRRVKISSELDGLIDNPVVLDNPDKLEFIHQWNMLVSEYYGEDEAGQYDLMPKIRVAAGRVLYGGLEPKTLPPDDLLFLVRQQPATENYGPADQQFRERYVDRIKGPLTGIRAYCVIKCQNGQPVLVRTCDCTTCPFWPFRMGNNPFFGKLPDAEAAAPEEPDEPETVTEETADADQEA